MTRGYAKPSVVRTQSPAPLASALRPQPARRAQKKVMVMVATRKGAWFYRGDAARKTWRADGPEVWYAGTSPQGLFRSADGGVTWAPFSSINDDPHCIRLCPTDPDRLYQQNHCGIYRRSTPWKPPNSNATVCY